MVLCSGIPPHDTDMNGELTITEQILVAKVSSNLAQYSQSTNPDDRNIPCVRSGMGSIHHAVPLAGRSVGEISKMLRDLS